VLKVLQNWSIIIQDINIVSEGLLMDGLQNYYYNESSPLPYKIKCLLYCYIGTTSKLPMVEMCRLCLTMQLMYIMFVLTLAYYVNK